MRPGIKKIVSPSRKAHKPHGCLANAFESCKKDQALVIAAVPIIVTMEHLHRILPVIYSRFQLQKDIHDFLE